MQTYKQQELIDAVDYINHRISTCMNSQNKFLQGTSQYTLLENRMHALSTAALLISQACHKADVDQACMIDEVALAHSLPPLASIIHKCEKAQSKFQEGSKNYKRYIDMIRIMKMAHAFVEDALQKNKSIDLS